MGVDAFAAALAYSLANEGSRYVNSPLDRGGPTRYGITLATLSDYRGTPCTASDVEAIAPPEVAAIYRARYWAPLRLGELRSQAVATATFDISVLCGTRAAAKMLQAAVGADPDGVVGPKTLAAADAMAPKAAILSLHAALVGYLTDLVRRVPAQRVWLTAWLTRAAKMLILPVATAPPVA